MQKQNKSPEEIAVSLLFYAFIVCMFIFAGFRLLGVGWFAQDYTSVEISPIISTIILAVYHIFEGVLILKILTKQKFWVCLLCSSAYTAILLLQLNPTLVFVLDIVYIVILPFILNEDKDKSMLQSCGFMLAISCYQLLMSFGRYGSASGKFDLVYQLLSTIDYKLFLIIILLYKFRRRK